MESISLNGYAFSDLENNDLEKINGGGGIGALMGGIAGGFYGSVAAVVAMPAVAIHGAVTGKSFKETAGDVAAVGAACIVGGIALGATVGAVASGPL